MFSRIQLFATPGTVVHQAPLCMEFSRQEHWTGLPFPTPSDLSDPGIEPSSLASPALACGFFITATSWEALGHKNWFKIDHGSKLRWCTSYCFCLELQGSFLHALIFLCEGKETYNLRWLEPMNLVQWWTWCQISVTYKSTSWEMGIQKGYSKAKQALITIYQMPQ